MNVCLREQSFLQVWRKGFRNQSPVEFFDLRDAANAAKKQKADAKKCAKLTAYANAAKAVFTKQKAVDKYTASELLSVLAYFMNGRGHTTVEKGLSVEESRAAKV